MYQVNYCGGLFVLCSDEEISLRGIRGKKMEPELFLDQSMLSYVLKGQGNGQGSKEEI